MLPEMDGAKAFVDAVDFANERTAQRESIVANSIASAIEGGYGDEHRTARTRGSRLWINPLMPMYWAFDLPAVVERNLYVDALKDTQTMMDVLTRIQAYRGRVMDRPWEEMPV